MRKPITFDEEHRMKLAIVLKSDLIATGGDMKRSAWRVGVSRKTAYDLVHYFGLWPVVNHCRKRKYEKLEVGRDLLQQTKLMTRG